MAGSLNKVQIIGCLGRDPEVRSFQNGGKICNLRIATSERWRDRQTGERKERTEWHSVALFNENDVKVAEQYLKKGSLVYIEGKLETRKWQDQSGQDRYATEIVIRPYGGRIVMLEKMPPGSRPDDRGGSGDYGGSYGGYDQSPDPNAGYGSQRGDHGGGRSNGNGNNDLDDEIAF